MGTVTGDARRGERPRPRLSGKLGTGTVTGERPRGPIPDKSESDGDGDGRGRGGCPRPGWAQAAECGPMASESARAGR